MLTCCIYNCDAAATAGGGRAEPLLSTSSAPVSHSEIFRVAEERRTAAGVLIYSYDSEKTPYILLGLRDDQDSWCNMEGKSDKSDKSLFETAAREVMEETACLYTFAPELLVNAPFAEYEKDDLLYRMYFAPAEMIDSKLLKAKAAGGAVKNTEIFNGLHLKIY